MLEPWGSVPDGEIAASTVDAFGRIIALSADGDLGVDGTSCGRVSGPGRYPLIDAAGEGFVLVNARCRIRPGFEPPHNGRILDGTGRTVTAFHAGDAVEALVTGPTGEIWTSYFDEASILDGGAERHHPGLIRWTAEGEPTWLAIDDSVRLPWMDCYVLNVAERRTWAVPYTEVPLWRSAATASARSGRRRCSSRGVWRCPAPMRSSFRRPASTPAFTGSSCPRA